MRETNEQLLLGGSCALSTFFFFCGEHLGGVSERQSGCRQGETGSRKGGEVEGGSEKVTQAGSEMDKLERGE